MSAHFFISSLGRIRAGVGAVVSGVPEDQMDYEEPDEGAGDAGSYEANSTDEIDSTAGGAQNDLRQLVTYLATNLVDQPNEVKVAAEQRGAAVHLRLRVPEEELGKVIGRQGRIARAMRTTVMIAGARFDVRASLDIEG